MSASTSSSSSASSSGGAITIAVRDPNCAKYNGTICSACSNRYYFGPSNSCVPVDPLCNAYSQNGACLTCYPGYSINGQRCIIARQQDPFCKSFSPGGICTGCYNGYFYNQKVIACQPLNPLCKTSNIIDGTCTSCFPGYNLANGLCGVSFQDPNCQKFDQAKGVCTLCSSRFFLDSTSKCRQSNPLCRTSDPVSGGCINCYPGYILSGVNCIVGGSSNSDVNCQTPRDGGGCTKCYSGYFLNNRGLCTQNNPLCKTIDQSNGNCLSCFPGYVVSNGNCTVGSSSTTSSDPNCKGTNAQGVCTGCYSGYYLSQGMNCLKMDPLCKTYTASFNACASCYDGYTPVNGQCIISTDAPSQNNDIYCIKTQGPNCIACSSGYYLSSLNGVCAQLNPLCKSSDLSNGACTDCYPGYVISGNTCIVATAVYIPYCAQTNGNVCVSCISGYYVSAGICALVNVLCATYDQSNGNCLSCIPGYVFQTGQCIMPSLGIDPNCAQYSNSYCTQCLGGYALINYFCSPIDPFCIQYDAPSNTCRACNLGKIPMGPSCI